MISDVLPGVKTTLKFKVTDNKTGLYVIEESSFTTIGKYSGGTLMLCKTGGEYDLTMLKKDGTTLYTKRSILKSMRERNSVSSPEKSS